MALAAAAWSPSPLCASTSTGYTAGDFRSSFRARSPQDRPAAQSWRALASAPSPTTAAVFPFAAGRTWSERRSARSASG